MTDGCEGCYLTQNDESGVMICTIFANHKQYIKECPCRTCLIKTMCCEGCEAYFKFKDKCRGIDYRGIL